MKICCTGRAAAGGHGLLRAGPGGLARRRGGLRRGHHHERGLQAARCGALPFAPGSGAPGGSLSLSLSLAKTAVRRSEYQLRGACITAVRHTAVRHTAVRHCSASPARASRGRRERLLLRPRGLADALRRARGGAARPAAHARAGGRSVPSDPKQWHVNVCLHVRCMICISSMPLCWRIQRGAVAGQV